MIFFRKKPLNAILNWCMICAVLILSAAFCFSTYLSSIVKGESTASEYVLQTNEAVTDYLDNKYYEVDSVTKQSCVKLDVPNYSQSTLNASFLKSTGTTVSGTCSEVAVTSLIEYYATLEGFTTHDSYEDTFADIMQLAMDKGYWKEDVGTYQTKLDSLVTDAFALYGVSHKGNNDYYNLYKTICSSVDSGVPVLFNIPDHTMVACGYVSLSVSYYKKSSSTSTTATEEDFVLCCEGWAKTNKLEYSLFPTDEISTNVFTRWEYCITKVI